VALPLQREAGLKRAQFLRGPAYMLGSAMLFAVLGLLIKVLGPQYRLWDIAVYRLLGGTIVLLAIFGWQQNLFKPVYPKLMLIRGITGTAAFLCLVTAIRSIPFSTTMALFYAFPAFAAVLSPLLFGERISLYEVGCLLVALIGVGVLFDLHIDGSRIGLLMGVSAAVLAGLTVAIIKKLREANGSVIIYFYFCMVGSAVCLGPFLAAPRMPDSFIDGLIVSGIVVTSIGAQLLMNHGFKYCKSWEGGLFMTSELIFTALLGIFLLQEKASNRFWIGAALILSSAVAFQLPHRANGVVKPRVS
jgi:drug/metabolite transporter (DMT)-like permease